MSAQKKIKYLKIDRGRYYYQRRVPDQFQLLLNERMWLKPCGDVSYSKAAQLVVTWAEEHDLLIAELKTPEGYKRAQTQLRRIDESLDGELIFHESYSYDGSVKLTPFDNLEKPWQNVLNSIIELDLRRSNSGPPAYEVVQLLARIERAERNSETLGDLILPAYPIYKDISERFANSSAITGFKLLEKLPPAMPEDEYLDRLIDLQNLLLPENFTPPENADDRDEFLFAKQKLERKISEVSPDPNTISAVSERYFQFNTIRTATRQKYRRELKRLISITALRCLSKKLSADFMRRL